MRYIIKLEELMMFIASIVYFYHLPFAWWVYPLLILLPDLSMIAYFHNAKTGAFFYNLFHHKGFALILLFAGMAYNDQTLEVAGTIMFGHSSMDRIFGYGLKYTDHFNHTHLGLIGQKKSELIK